MMRLLQSGESMAGLMTDTLDYRATVLAVDDNPTTLRLIEAVLTKGNYQVITAQSGQDAMNILAGGADRIDVIILDRMMPGMDGIEFCQSLKEDDRNRLIPVIMQTGAGKSQEIREGIEAGVFYYLVKPVAAETLLSIVDSAKDKVNRYRQRRREFLQRRICMSLIDSLTCSLRTIEEAENMAAFLALFFPKSDLVLVGISELLINGIEHGNLEISYEMKSELVDKNFWQEEVNRRLALPPYQDRQVTVRFARKENHLWLQITDEGKGFAWQNYLEVDLDRVTHNHGRGIAMARIMSFDELSYNEKGNQVTCIVHLQ